MVKVGVVMPAEFADGGEFLADVRSLDAAGADTIGLDADGPHQWVLLGAIAAVTQRLRLRVSSTAPAAVLRDLSRGRVVVGEPVGERWVSVDMPANRDLWTAMLREQEAAGATGVVVPWDPRLVDLLRNPEPDDRSDLLMSTG